MGDLVLRPKNFGPMLRSRLHDHPKELRTLGKKLGLSRATQRRIVEGKTVEARIVRKVVTRIFRQCGIMHARRLSQ